jgi:DNA-binding NtrC family response regulator
MVSSVRNKILVLNHDRPLLRTYAVLLERRGYKVVSVDSVVQMILKLEAREDRFDLLFVECCSRMRENPANFIRFVRETQAASYPALILSGIGAQDVLRVAREEGMTAAVAPQDIEEFLSMLAGMLNGTKTQLDDGQCA